MTGPDVRLAMGNASSLSGGQKRLVLREGDWRGGSYASDK